MLLHCREKELIHLTAKATTLAIFSAGFNCEFEPVEGGSKLALVYRLVQRSVAPLPVFEDIIDIVHTLQTVAESWEAEKSLPKRAFHILDDE